MPFPPFRGLPNQQFHPSDPRHPMYHPHQALLQSGSKHPEDPVVNVWLCFFNHSQIVMWRDSSEALHVVVPIHERFVNACKTNTETETLKPLLFHQTWFNRFNTWLLSLETVNA
ncbi:hypothetical protein CAEBREN_32380 [Caenorhabditis brenneri]|uniref:Uncharacterized protein n=1 Tax=Caenorhabditis brenneri TaxID=135651 RepID=G0P2L4_CAEBE|nr:hypothetical protein CAEBREN_32380 [Caenorhabditis brenneri]